MSSIKEVAQAAGVSTATVSRVLSNKPHVRQELKEHVLKVAQEMNYRPNGLARSLRTQKADIIGLIVSDIQNPFFTMVSRAVEDAASEQGLNVFLCNSDSSPEKEAMYLEHMRDQRISGLIISPSDEFRQNFSILRGSHLPVVIIDRQYSGEDIDCIQTNNFEAAFLATSHLAEHGYENIAAIFGSESSTGRERHAGYIEALNTFNIPKNDKYIKFIPATELDGFLATKALLTQPNPPRALFASNGLLAAGALRALHHLDIRIPDQLALLTFDDTPWAALTSPKLSVIAQPTYDIGRTAFELLAKRMNNPERAARTLTLNSQMILRNSCGC